MAAKPKTTKEIAERIDPGYFRKWHRLRRARFVASATLFVIAVLWVAGAWALGDESLYSNGAVSASHRFIENECAQCHTEGFGSIHDASCLACHQTAQHVPLGSGKRDPACATCHAEHRDLMRLAHVSNRHCDACHDEHKNIRDFESHLRFKPYEHDQKIRFNHVAHLDKDLQGGPIDCDACHQPDPTGEFRPISFDVHCVACHKERLIANLDVVVLHGMQPNQIRPWVTAILLSQQKKPTQPGWEEALEKNTDGEMTLLFTEGRGCLLCHEGDKQSIQSPRIPRNWLPKARFNHKAHRFESCDRCHKMTKNETAAQLSLPTVEVCRTCHKPGGAPGTCAACHPFHPTEHAAAWR